MTRRTARGPDAPPSETCFGPRVSKTVAIIAMTIMPIEIASQRMRAEPPPDGRSTGAVNSTLLFMLSSSFILFDLYGRPSAGAPPRAPSPGLTCRGGPPWSAQSEARLVLNWGGHGGAALQVSYRARRYKSAPRGTTEPAARSISISDSHSSLSTSV